MRVNSVCTLIKGQSLQKCAGKPMLNTVSSKLPNLVLRETFDFYSFFLGGTHTFS